MSGSEAVEILYRLGEGEDLEAGTEAVYLTRLETETDLDRQGDALRSLAALPSGDGVERQLRMEKARRALETNPDHPQSVAGVVKAAFKAGSPATGGESNVPGRPLSWEEVEPWPHPVTGEEIAGAFEDTLRRYVVLPDGGPVAVTLWALNTYVFDAFNVCPILALTSPLRECGKTTARNVLAGLVRRAWKCTASISPSAIFRATDFGRDDPPTILIDEVDNLFTGRGRDQETEIKTLLNSGYTRDEQAVRNVLVGNNYEPREFSTWTPKALFLIDKGGLPDTIRSRAIEVPMRRLEPGEKVEDFDIGEIQEQLLPLRQKAARWGKDHRQIVRRLARSAKLPPGMRGRLADNWRPLLTIAEALGGPWLERAWRAWESLSALKIVEGEEDIIGVQLLADAQAILESPKWRGKDRIFTRDLVSELHLLEDRPWKEWKRGIPITPTQIGRLLKPFTPRVQSQTIWEGDESAKGYYREHFEPLWASYLSSSRAGRAEDPPAKRQRRQRRQDPDFTGVSEGVQGVRAASPEGSEHGIDPPEPGALHHELTPPLPVCLTPPGFSKRLSIGDSDALTPLTPSMEPASVLALPCDEEPCPRALSGECDGSCDGKCQLHVATGPRSSVGEL